MDLKTQPEAPPLRRILGWINLPIFLALVGGTLLFANLCQVLILPVALLSRRWHRRLNLGIADTWWSILVLWQRHVLQMKIVFSGDTLPRERSAMIIGNHQAMADIPALLDLAKRTGTLSGVKFFVKQELGWVPGLGWGMKFLDFLFVKRSWAEDAAFVRRMFARLRTYESPVWVFNFPEGTRMRPKKLAKSQAFAEKHGYPRLEHLLLPRSKGFVATIESLRDRFDGVYDCTIGFPHGVPTLFQYMRGVVSEVHVHVHRFPIHTLPLSESDLEKWLVDRFVEKDKLLDGFLRTRHF